jgi:hypothetical protein
VSKRKRRTRLATAKDSGETDDCACRNESEAFADDQCGNMRTVRVERDAERARRGGGVCDDLDNGADVGGRYAGIEFGASAPCSLQVQDSSADLCWATPNGFRFLHA